jgi:hypothetical protein
VDLVADAQRGGFGLGQKGADFPAGLAAAFPDGMGAEDAEGIAVVSADYGFDFFKSHAGLFVIVRHSSWNVGPGGAGLVIL